MFRTIKVFFILASLVAIASCGGGGGVDVANGGAGVGGGDYISQNLTGKIIDSPVKGLLYTGN